MHKTFTLFDLLNSEMDNMTDEEFAKIVDEKTQHIDEIPNKAVTKFITDYSKALEIHKSAFTGEISVIQN